MVIGALKVLKDFKYALPNIKWKKKLYVTYLFILCDYTEEGNRYVKKFIGIIISELKF